MPKLCDSPSAKRTAIALIISTSLLFNLNLAARAAQATEPSKIVGEDTKLILSTDGQVFYGKNRKEGLVSIKLPERAKDIALCRHAHAVLENGKVVSWDPQAANTIEIQIGIEQAQQVSCSGDTILVLLQSGQVMGWGSREQGKLGDGKHPKRYLEDGPRAKQPVLIQGLEDIVQISMGGSHVLALNKAQKVFSWGSNTHGALGRPPRQELPMDTPQEVPNLSEVSMVIAGNGVSTVLKNDGTVWVWGANWHAQFGNGERTDPPGMTSGWVLQAEQVKGIQNAVAISSGLTGRHTMVLLKDGSLRAWGNTDWGQIGAGVSGRFQEKPVVPAIKDVKRVFAVGNHTFAVKKDGGLWAWGYGDQRSWPLNSNTKIPVKIELPSIIP